MPIQRKWLFLSLISLMILLGTFLGACENKGEKENTEAEEKVTSIESEEKEDEIFFEERAIELDHSKAPEEILANYTEKGMNLFKANFPDTLSMNYALKSIGKEAPDLKGKTIDGKEISLSDLKGKNVLISFNKTTCSVCQEMASVIKEVADQNKEVVFVHVFPVDSNKDIKAYYKKLKQDVPNNVLSLENNKHLKDFSIDEYNIEQVPTYVFVDEYGKIAYTYIGNKDAVMFQDMMNTAFGKEKLYDNVRNITIRVDRDGNEIVEEKLIDENIINEDGIDHTKTNVNETKK